MNTLIILSPRPSEKSKTRPVQAAQGGENVFDPRLIVVLQVPSFQLFRYLLPSQIYPLSAFW
jgi:hypothetical protein